MSQGMEKLVLDFQGATAATSESITHTFKLCKGYTC